MVWLAWFAAGMFFMCTCSLIAWLILLTRAEYIEVSATVQPRGKYTLGELIDELEGGA